MDILYNAYLGTNSSWALVGRYTIRELIKLGHRVKASSTNGWNSSPPDISALSSVTLDRPVFLGYTIPSRLRSIPSKTKFLIYNYESSMLPSGWAAAINGSCSLVLPASTYAAEVMKRSGVNQDKIRIFPYGVDQTIFRGGVEPFVQKDKFNFLYCAIPHARKGIDILFEAFLKTFAGKDDVRLILKTSPRQDKKKRPTFIIDPHVVLSEIKARLGGPKFPEVMIIEDDLDINGLVSVYNSADVYVAPTRAEGFGMTILEAMSCGVPVITTRYSAHSDFVNDSNAYVVGATEMPAPVSMQYWQYQRGAVVGDPDMGRLSEYMLDVYRNGPSKSKAAAGLATAREYTWTKSVKKLEGHMLEYLSNSRGGGSRKYVAPYTAPTTPRTPVVSVPNPVTSVGLSRTDIRARQSGKLTARDAATVSSVRQYQKTQPIQSGKKMSPTLAAMPPHGSVTNVHAQSDVRGAGVQKSVGLMAQPTRSFRKALFMLAADTGNDLAPIFGEVTSLGIPTTTYANRKPDFLGSADQFVQCKRHEFNRYLIRLPYGMIIVGDSLAFEDKGLLSTASAIGANGKMFCYAVDTAKIDRLNDYPHIIMLYGEHTVSDDIGKVINSGPHIWVSATNPMSILGREILPGGISI